MPALPIKLRNRTDPIPDRFRVIIDQFAIQPRVDLALFISLHILERQRITRVQERPTICLLKRAHLPHEDATSPRRHLEHFVFGLLRELGAPIIILCCAAPCDSFWEMARSHRHDAVPLRHVQDCWIGLRAGSYQNRHPVSHNQISVRCSRGSGWPRNALRLCSGTTRGCRFFDL